MILIHELLSRIRQDKRFVQGGFVIGYYGSVADYVVRVPLREIFLEPCDYSLFDLFNHEGLLHSIPLSGEKRSARTKS